MTVDNSPLYQDSSDFSENYRPENRPPLKQWSLISTSHLQGAFEVTIDALVPSPFQIRTDPGDSSLDELAADIKVRGILQPVVVRTNDEDRYEIISGWRRYLAATKIGLKKIPVLVREMSDTEARLAMLVENVQRKELDPRDEQAYFRLLRSDYNKSVADIAHMINKSRAYVRNRLEGDLVRLRPVMPESLPAKNQPKAKKPAKSLPSGTTRLTPALITRYTRVLNHTLEQIEAEPLDEETRRLINHNLKDMEKAVKDLRRKLGVKKSRTERKKK